MSRPTRGFLRFKNLIFVDLCESLRVHFQPPAEFNLKSDWSGSPVEFYSNVNYSCASPDFHFEADFDQPSWEGAVCLSNGSWELVDDWPFCLKSNNSHSHVGEFHWNRMHAFSITWWTGKEKVPKTWPFATDLNHPSEEKTSNSFVQVSTAHPTHLRLLDSCAGMATWNSVNFSFSEQDIGK